MYKYQWIESYCILMDIPKFETRTGPGDIFGHTACKMSPELARKLSEEQPCRTQATPGCRNGLCVQMRPRGLSVLTLGVKSVIYFLWKKH